MSRASGISRDSKRKKPGDPAEPPGKRCLVPFLFPLLMDESYRLAYGLMICMVVKLIACFFDACVARTRYFNFRMCWRQEINVVAEFFHVSVCHELATAHEVFDLFAQLGRCLSQVQNLSFSPLKTFGCGNRVLKGDDVASNSDVVSKLVVNAQRNAVVVHSLWAVGVFVVPVVSP